MSDARRMQQLAGLLTEAKSAGHVFGQNYQSCRTHLQYMSDDIEKLSDNYDDFNEKFKKSEDAEKAMVQSAKILADCRKKIEKVLKN